MKTLPSKIQIFKFLFLIIVMFLMLWILVTIHYLSISSFVEEYALTAVFDAVMLTLSILNAVIFLAFLFYLYCTAKILKENGIINLPPWVFVLLEIISTLPFGILSVIIPIYMLVKSKKLLPAGAQIPAPETRRHVDAEERTAGKRNRPVLFGIAITLAIVAILVEIWLLTVGLLLVLWSYDVTKDFSNIVGYLIAHAVVISLIIVGFKISSRCSKKWGRGALSSRTNAK